MYQNIERAISRMSFDYSVHEAKLKQRKRKQNATKVEAEKETPAFTALIEQLSAAADPISKMLRPEAQTYISNIGKSCMLKCLHEHASVSNTTRLILQLIHMSEFELVYWHIINLKMVEEGLWSQFVFEKSHQADKTLHTFLSDLLLMSCLKAKQISNEEDEYQIYEQFVFHNYGQ